MKRTQLPHEFLHSIHSLLGDGDENFFSALACDSPVSVRLNPYKSARNPLLISAEMLEGEVGWSGSGYYLKERPSFTFDPLFHAGYYYVQEASSMFVEHIARQLVKEPVSCLDLCASPGGKSIGLRSALPYGSLLVSNEIIRHRAHILSENLTKFGHPNTLVCNNSPSDFGAFPHFFDLILVDAPCSGEGLFRKDPEAVSEWSPGNVRMCAGRQRKILSDIWGALKPGGILIYSTCTYNTSENEENVRWMVREFGAVPLAVPVRSAWNISSSFLDDVEAYRFFPHKTKGEGFFVSVLQKPEEGEVFSSSKKKTKTYPFAKDEPLYKDWLRSPQDFNFIEDANRVTAVSKSVVEPIMALWEKLGAVSFGIEMGEWKGKSFIPSHALAMSWQLNREKFPVYDLSYKEAIVYLRSEVLRINAPTGYVLLTYKNEPLGFVKNIGNRANNLYPQEWRIRSKNLPDKMDGFLE